MRNFPMGMAAVAAALLTCNFAGAYIPSSAWPHARQSITQVVSLEKRHTLLHNHPPAAENDPVEPPVTTEGNNAVESLVLLGLIPALSLSFPPLLEAVRTAASHSAGPGPLLSLLIWKRCYVYFMAGSVVVVTAKRASTEDDPRLGERLKGLTSEVLYGRSKPEVAVERMESLNSIAEPLDQMDASSQAVALPALVAALLALSVISIGALKNMPLDMSRPDDLSALDMIGRTGSTVSRAWNAGLLACFARMEVQRPLLGTPYEDTAFLISVLLVCAAYFGPMAVAWPAQNLVCMCLAIGVGRAIQLPRLPAVLLALIGLVVYDVVAVGSQAMTTVAFAKVPMVVSGAAGAAAGGGGGGGAGVVLSSGGGGLSATQPVWQPGALQVVFGGRLTDLLGLGDAVFPSILATWALAFDKRQQQTTTPSDVTADDETVSLSTTGGWGYFEASLVGFTLGCVACELGPGASTGQPALLYLVPSMLCTVLLLAVLRGDLAEMWSYDAVSAMAEKN
uniref:Uncharacterized protein n=1 Tax=Octactis speculum TaxID=3111310 RepID=A0A7S2C8M9_9STRA|mmetsp:Transcript_32366/g.43784  ORF Transcript_32366/g.43784 Transcript_32366/m.43784 type:complete len:508 (+) Transcript_32366:3-1526(+)